MYYDATVPLSKEARISIWVGIIVTLFIFLLDPKESWERVSICAALFVFVVLLVADSEWVKQPAWNMNIFADVGMSERVSYLRLFSAISVIGITVLGFAVITWPPKDQPSQPLSVVVVGQPATSTDSPVKAIGIPNPTNKLTPKSSTPKGSLPSKPSVPKPKPPPEPKPHPIIVVSNSTVTINSDTHKVDIKVSLMNTSGVGANVHLVSDITWNGQPVDGSIDTRDVAVAPSPFLFELHFSTTPNAQGEIEFINGTSKIAIVINASYPDNGGVTTYRYEGVVVPGATILNATASDWDTEPAKK